MKNVLITGGAGFIGSHTADLLYSKGYNITILDNLHPKNHTNNWPSYLNHGNFELVKGNVLDATVLLPLLQKANYVIHLAAEMDLTPEFQKFIDVNVGSTALIYQLIVQHKLPVKKVIVAASQFAYGEGIWHCNEHGDFVATTRSIEQMQQQKWDIQCPKCQCKATYKQNSESLPLNPINHYALSKFFQEELALRLGKLYQIPSVSMRYSIVHGSRQSLKNTYSGALRTFALSYKAGLPFATFEDNLSMRDFIAIQDVATANWLVLEKEEANYKAFNVGSGKQYSVLDLANYVATAFNTTAVFSPVVEFRVGDTRHAVSECEGLHALGWQPQVTEQQVVKDYIDWFKEQEVDIENFIKVQKIIRENGTVLKA